MAELTANDFAKFYQELYNFTPFPWQRALLYRVLSSGWPAVIDLPTASGKTAAIDIAVFAMALHQQGPRRLFFVVDRRVVVDAAFERMQALTIALENATDGVLKMVADRLRGMTADPKARPLEAYQLRGGIYRDNDWVRSPLQPTVIASTVDQVGSRLLFRGYGLSETLYPIHAALVAHDSLLLLDEAHYSRPFAATLRAVQHYQGRDWNEGTISHPLTFVEMTATPSRDGEEPFRLDEESDFTHPELQKRLYASKPAALVVSKTRLKEYEKFAEELAKKAIEFAKEPGIRRIAVMVNRVQTARYVHQYLQKEGEAHLLIGRMRPIDRLNLPSAIDDMLSGKEKRSADAPPVFVVATQCLEVGADLDFDALVTEGASIEALLQRFGRLDRIGALAGEGITPRAAIALPTPMTDQKYEDPIYGTALSATWNWLSSIGETVEFGVASRNGSTVRERLESLSAEQAQQLRRQSPKSPALLPMHLDLFAQTHPVPAIDPDPHLFLHGKENGRADVQVVWRADLSENEADSWTDIVAACPPVSAEAMTVPIGVFAGWWRQNKAPVQSSDIEGADDEEGGAEPATTPAAILRRGLLWRGEDSKLIRNDSRAVQPRPGDTIILPRDGEGWNELGHIPDDSPKDAAEWARSELKRRWIVRLHPAILTSEDWPKSPARDALVAAVAQDDLELETLKALLREYAKIFDAGHWLGKILKKVPARLRFERYPGNGAGWILSGPGSEVDAGGDESSSGEQVGLEEHLEHVTREVERFVAALLPQADLRQSALAAAPVHDWGKADPRFQILLRGDDKFAAQFSPKLLAKGTTRNGKTSARARAAQREQSGLPSGFRHELVSLLLLGPTPPAQYDDLALHLVASHHGRCRPFAPVVFDEGPELEYRGHRVSPESRRLQAAHRVDSGVAERFWQLTRQHGWWGLAYLEAIFRLADWRASELEQEDRKG